MAFLRAGLTGERPNIDTYIFDDDFVNGYEDVTITARGGTYYNNTYWGQAGSYDGKTLSTLAAKTSPNFSNKKYKYLKIHVYQAYASFGAINLYIINGNTNEVLKTITIFSMWSTSSISDRWYTIDLSTLGLETDNLSLSFAGQCGYESGQNWGIKMDKIYLTNDEE